MERLKMMKDCLMAQVQAQMGNLEKVDAHELGEAVDMIKDLEEAMYYCSIVKAMEKKEKEGSWENNSSIMFYTERPDGMRYNYNTNNSHTDYNDMEYYSDKGRYRKDKNLEKYLQELATDISEIITTATTEEKQMLHRKLAALTTKVEQNV